MRKVALFALALIAACSPKPSDPAKPESYALVLPVTPAPGNGVQQVVLPGVAIEALQREDAGDVRIFDASGKVIALARSVAGPAADQQQTRVPAYPIAGPAAVPGAPAITVRINQPEQDVSVEAQGAKSDATVNGQTALLLDTRKLDNPAVAIVLEAELPKNLPVEVTVESSGDLKNWEPLGSKVLFRPGDGIDVAPAQRIELPGVTLEDRYVRVSWPKALGVAIHGGSVITATSAPPAQVEIPAGGAKLDNARELRFAIPLALPLAAIRVTGEAKGGLVPIRLFGRENDEASWVPLAAAVLRQGQSAKLELSGSTVPQYRLKADSRSAGFLAAPKLELLVDPVILLAAFNGNGPYFLAVGNKAAPSAYFALGEVLGTQPQGVSLPRARVSAPTTAPVVTIAPAGNDGPFSPRKLALWAALLAATGVLALAAVRLMRSGGATRP